MPKEQTINSMTLLTLQKLEKMAEYQAEVSSEILTTVTGIKSSLTQVIATELIKQTKILENLAKQLSTTGKSNRKEFEQFAKAFGGPFAKGLTMLVDAASKMKKDAGQKIKTFLTDLSNGLAKFTKALKPEALAQYGKGIFILGLGILGFALAMIIATPFIILAIPGIMAVGLAIRAFIWAIGGDSKKRKETFESLKLLALTAKGILWFVLAMSLAAIAAPLVVLGALVVGGSIRLMMWAIGGDSKRRKETFESLKMLAVFSKAVLWYVLAMVLVSIAAPLVLIGALVVGFSIRIMMWAIGGDDKERKERMKSLAMLRKIAVGILLFVLAMLLVTLAAPIMLIGAFVFALSVKILAWGMKAMGDKKVQKGVKALLWSVLAVILLALGLYLFDQLVTWESMAKAGAAVLGLSLVLVGMGLLGKEVQKGAIALILGAGAVMILALALMVFVNAGASWEDLAMLGALILGIAIIGTIAGIPPIDGFIMMGSAALIVAATAVMLMATAMVIFKQANMSWEDVGILGGTIAMLGIEFGIIGIPVVAAFVALGAASMTIAALALLPITGALAVFKTINWKEEDSKSLSYAIVGIRNAFLGLEGDEGFFGALKAIAGSMAMAAAMVPIAAMYIVAGVSLVTIGAALSVFKSVGFTNEDADNMKYVITSIAKAFSEPFKDMGVLEFIQMSLGISVLSKAGTTLANLAQGVQDWANLTAPVWEWDEDRKELVVKRRVKLTKDDFVRVGEGMKAVIGSIAGPFAEVGKLELGLSGDDPWYAAIFGGNYVSKGIAALANAGTVMSGLASGTQAWANMTITEWDVVQTDDGPELRPVKKTKLTEKDIDAATRNMAKVATSVATVFAEIGKINEGEKSSDPRVAILQTIFGGDYVKKGIESLGGIGDVITGLAKGIVDFANLEFVSHKIAINSKTGMPEMVPDKVIKLDQSMIEQANMNIALVASSVARTFAKIGEGSFWKKNSIDPDDVEDGVKSLTGIGDVIRGLAEGVKAFASMEFIENEVRTVNGVPTIVPKRVTKLTQADLNTATKNIELVGMSLAKAMANIGTKLAEGDLQETATKASDFFSESSAGLSSIAEALTKTQTAFDKISPDGMEKMGSSIGGFMTTILNTFKETDTREKITSFQLFAENMTNIADNAANFASISTNMDKIAVSMGKFKDNVNNLDLERLTKVDAIMESLKEMSKISGGIEGLADAIAESLDKGFENLADMIEELITKAGGKVTTPGGIPIGGNKPGTPTNKDQKDKKEKIDLAPVTNAINELKLTLVANGIKIKNIAELNQ